MEPRERDHIRQNLAKLVKSTDVNRTLLSYLQSHNILSNSDVHHLDSISKERKKVNDLYKILFTRVEAYEVLTQAFLETNQTEAYSILRKLNDDSSHQEPQPAFQTQFTSKPNGLDEFLHGDGYQQLLILYTLDCDISSKRMTETTGIKTKEIKFEGKELKQNVMTEILSENVVCLKLQEVQKILNYLDNHGLQRNKKIIVITEQKEEEIFQEIGKYYKIIDIIKVLPDKFKWLDLDLTFRKTMLQRNISDQGRVKTLQMFCAPIVYEHIDDYLSRLNEEILVGLLNNTTPVIYWQTVPPVRFYVSRKIHRRGFTNPRLFAHGHQHSVNDFFIFSGFNDRNELAVTINRGFISSEKLVEQHIITAQYIWLVQEEHFAEVCSKIPMEKNIHCFVKINEGITWKKSRGSIESITNFIQSFPNPAFTYEDEFLKILEQSRGDAFSTPFICICDTPGMGKSILLANLGRKLMEKYEDRRVIFVVFTEFMEILRQANLNSYGGVAEKETVLEAISQLVSSSSFGNQIFKENANQIVDLLFDGLDEVQQEKINFAIQRLKLIPTILKGARVFVTARPHLLHKLEKELNTVGYNIEPFQPDDQEKFLSDFWSQNRAVLHQTINSSGLILFARACLKKLKSTLNNMEWNIAGIPLQCLLIAEVFNDKGEMYSDPKNKLSEEIADGQVSIKSITELYERLVDKKLEAYEKRYLKKHFKKANKTCTIVIHGYLSFALMFPEWIEKIREHVLTKNIHKIFDTMCLTSKYSQKEFLQGNIPKNDLHRMGFMESVENDGKPQFIHRTVAEFFAAAYIIELLKQNCSFEMIEFIQQAALQTEPTEIQVSKFLRKTGTLQRFKNPVVCYFLNVLMETNSLSLSQIHTNSLTPTIISACVENNLMQMFTCLSESAPNLVNDQLLLTTVQTSSIELLQQILETKTLDKCVREMLFIAVERGDYDVFNLIYNLVEAQAFLKTEANLFNLMSACVSNTQNDDEQVLKDKFDILKLLLHRRTLNCNRDNLILCSCVHIKFLLELLSSCEDILIVADSSLQTILHKCAEYLSPSDYHRLISNIQENKVKKLMTFKDKFKMTPLHRLVWHLEPLEETIEFFSKHQANFNAEDNCGTYILWLAISSSRSTECLETLIKYGANINNVDKYGRNALHIAVMHGNLGLIKWLIEDMKFQPKTKDNDGNTPLYYALYNDNETAFQILIQLVDAGGKLKVRNNEKQSLLHFAARQGNPRPFQYLLQQGLDVDAADERGNSVLHHALNGSTAEKVDNVLKLVSDHVCKLVKIKNKNGETALTSLLKQTHFFVNLKILEYLATHPKINWDNEEISLAVKYLESRSNHLGQEICSSLINLIKNKGNS